MKFLRKLFPHKHSRQQLVAKGDILNRYGTQSKGELWRCKCGKQFWWYIIRDQWDRIE